MKLRIASTVAILAGCAYAAAAQAQTAGPQGSPSREQEWRIPAAKGAMLSTTVYRPRGDGPWPLVIANHGSPASDAIKEFENVSDWFVKQGYVVAVPWRRGYGRTGGAMADGMGSCAKPTYARAGAETASDIKAVMDHLRGQSFVAPTRTIVVGHSAGGWGSMAMSASNPPGVSAMVNFGGGRGGRCEMSDGTYGVGAPDQLVELAGKWGATARVPMLWIYASNDSFFNPALVRRMYDAYTGAGGRAELHDVGAIGNDGHQLLSTRPGLAAWQPLLTTFIKDK